MTDNQIIEKALKMLASVDVNGVHAWREKHELTWADAFNIAREWLSIVPID